MPDERAIDDNIAFEIWEGRTLLRGRRWFWHCKSVQRDGGGNSRIVFAGQASGYASHDAAMNGVNIARGTSLETPVHRVFR